MRSKSFARVGAIASLALGVALHAWVVYDAGDIHKALGLGVGMDEATVALVSSALSYILMGVGAYSLYRAQRAAARSMKLLHDRST